jgi:aspartate-semialdehyde dehydrogenase
MHDNVPLIIPEVNPEAIAGYKESNIIANPNCSTIQMLVALKPLHEYAPIKRIVVSTYQSVSGAGKEAMDELYYTTKGKFEAKQSKSPEVFTKPIAFNVIPHIDTFMDDGYTKEEWKMIVETKKILDPAIEVTATCVRVPIFIGHAESINLEFDAAIDADTAVNLLREAEGVAVIDSREDGGYITPVEAVKEDYVYVSRVRKDPTVEFGLNLWVVADNLRKGAALNAVQIAEKLVAEYI